MRNLSRRELLRRSAGAAIGLAGLPRVLGAQPGRAAPSERLTLGVIGVKKMGGAHVETLLGFPDVQLIAICDVDEAARTAAAAKVNAAYAAQARSGAYAACTAYHAFEDLLARPDLDAVVIATPDHWHALIAIAACRAGKDVYCEKPLSLTIRQARAMVNAARQYGRVFQTGTQQRSAPEFRRACELVRSGYLGALQSVHVECGPPSRHIELPAEPVPPGFDYERWLGPAPWAPYNRLRVGSNYDDGWRKFRDYSGGKMTDWGAHHFDIAQWGLGMDDSGPVEIIPPPDLAAKQRAWVVGDLQRKHDGAFGTPAEPTWGLRYRYASGVAVVKDHTNGVLFVGSEGRIEVNREHLQMWPDKLQSVVLRPSDVQLPRSPGHHQDWFDCIRTRRRPIADVAIGCRSVSVCHLGNIACWVGRAIRWDPAREEIVGDEAAARWLDRPMRAPYRL
jgi:predicted dehydrogenase